MACLNRLRIFIACGLLLISVASVAEEYVEQWQQGLSGAKLTAYSGSVISSNSTLTTVSFRRDGRDLYYKEGSWSVPGMANGASNNTITGRWQVLQSGDHAEICHRRG